MKPSAGSFALYRQTRPRSRWKKPDVPEFDPSWMVAINMPGQPRERKLRPHLPICPDCRAHRGNPALDRPGCMCVRAVRTWATEELQTRTYLMQQGKLAELHALRTPPKLTPLHRVVEAYLERGPADAKARRNALRAMWEQSTGRPFLAMDWPDLTRALVLDWAELRQEAGRRGWLGLGKKAPADGWDKLRALKAAGKLPALDRRTPAAWNTTIMGYLTQAKSMLGEDARQHVLRGLLLPDLRDFLATTLDLPTNKGHKEIGAEAWGKMIEAADELKRTNLRLWVVHELLLRLSCRPIEVAAALPSWLVTADGRTRILIQNRPEEGFRLKAGASGRERAIYLTPELAAAVAQVATPASLIGARTKTEARRLVYYDHSAWMRRFVPAGSTQTNYLLRHSGAAERMTSGDATKAAALLGHATSALTETTYGRVLEPLEPITDAEILRRLV